MSGTAASKIGLVGLISMVAGSIIGGGMFAMPQNMAAHAALGPILIAWVITFVGMLGLVRLFMMLAEYKPDINAGVFAYAREGFGDFWGFNIAWGYWLATAAGNVVFAVMINDALAHFFPVLQTHGVPTLLLGLVLIWAFYFMVVRGVQQASFMNTVTLVVKVVAILIITLLLLYFADFSKMGENFWGTDPSVGAIGAQIKSPMIVTLWAFIGIEGAVVISGRAKKKSDVGKATFWGFVLVLGLYMALSILPFGVLSQHELAGLSSPSAAYLFPTQLGEWYVNFVILALLVSIGGAWVAWTIIVAEVPMVAAELGILPKAFMKVNDKHAPSGALLISSITMTLLMVFVIFAEDVYFAALNIATVMYLPAYAFSGAYLWKIAADGSLTDQPGVNKKALFVGIWSTLYCVWLFYAGGLGLLLLSSMFYAAGVPVYYYTAKEHNRTVTDASSKIGSVVLVAVGVLAAVLLANGMISAT